MHVAMVKGCGGCPFSREARAVTGVFCAHPKAPYGTHIGEDEASSGRLPEACPLRRWSVLVQAAEAPVTEERERACCDLHSAKEEG